MNFFQAGLLGIIEGLTEFLPISSTFHLIFASRLLGISSTEFVKAFEVIIQAGAILAVLFVYIKLLVTDWQLVKKIITAFVPTAVVGLLLYKVIKNIFFTNNILMISVFIIVGCIFLIYEWIIKKQKIDLSRTLASFTYKEALLIGGMQSLAVIPGVSRAGAVILGMMLLKFKREEAAKFSFLLALPTIIAASGLDLIKSKQVIFSSTAHVELLAIGFIISFITAYIVIKWFIKFLQTHTLVLFGWYRILVGFLLFFFGR